MSIKVNLAWLLPVLTLCLGAALAHFLLHSASDVAASQELAVSAKKEVAVTQDYSFNVTEVTLPPKALAYQPQLIANLEHDKVVITAPKAVAVKAKEKAAPLTSVSGDSPLAARFNRVLAQMQQEQEQPKQHTTLHAKPLEDYPQWFQTLVPALNFSAHIYADSGDERWVKVNKQVVKEGELIDSNMRLVAIGPQQVVIEMQQRQFILPSLATWK